MHSAHNMISMSKPQTHQIRETPLTGAIRSIRKRLQLGQIEFTVLVLDKYVTGAISRWERGRYVPGIKNLLRLLILAETPHEREPILEALKDRGVDAFQRDLLACADQLADVQPYPASFPEKVASTSPHTSIGSQPKECNV